MKKQLFTCPLCGATRHVAAARQWCKRGHQQAEMRPASVTKAVDTVLKVAKRRLRGKQKAPTKVPLYIRIDPAALEAWRNTGKGWQTRLAETIADHAPQEVQ